MKERKRKIRIEIWVGGFVLLGTAALFIAILLIGRERHFFEKKYQVRTIFSKTAGLRMGAPVKLAGLDVGNVKNMVFNEQGKIEILLEVRDTFRKQVREDSIARISTVGLMGDKMIEITVGSQAAKSLKPGDLLKSEDPLDVSDIMEMAKPSLRDLERAMKNIAEFTEKLESSRGELSALVTNIKEISDDIRHGEGTVGMLIKDRKPYDDLQVITGSGAKLVQELEAAAGRSLPKVESLVDNTEKASRDFKPILSSAQKSANDLEISMKNLRAAAEELPETVRQGKEAVANLNKTLKSVQGSWLLGGGGGPGETLPHMGRTPLRMDLYAPAGKEAPVKEGGK